VTPFADISGRRETVAAISPDSCPWRFSSLPALCPVTGAVCFCHGPAAAGCRERGRGRRYPLARLGRRVRLTVTHCSALKGQGGGGTLVVWAVTAWSPRWCWLGGIKYMLRCRRQLAQLGLSFLLICSAARWTSSSRTRAAHSIQVCFPRKLTASGS
jgi:hypothetical protein